MGNGEDKKEAGDKKSGDREKKKREQLEGRRGNLKNDE